jgi:NTE family protein
LLRELRAIEFVKRLIREEKVSNNSMKEVLVHMVSDDALMRQLSVATKLIPEPYVLKELREAGEKSAKLFLTKHFDDLGTVGSTDLQAMFA